MKIFLWVVIILASLSAIGKLFWLASDIKPDREAHTEAIDVAINFIIAFWAIILLM